VVMGDASKGRVSPASMEKGVFGRPWWPVKPAF